MYTLQDKKVVVTGGSGFLGKHLVELLLEEDAVVFVLDDFSRGKNIVKGAHYTRVDVGSETACRTAFEDADVVFNLAAYVAGVIYNQGHHAEMFANNVRLLTTPVIAAEAKGVPVFIQLSSACVYGEAYNAPAVEENGWLGVPVQANIGYSQAKRMGEMMLSWSNIPRRVAIRPQNLYGPGDYFDDRAHVIPALIKKALNDDVVVLHGSGEEVREFLYVEDAARGLIHAALYASEGVRSYNLGTGGRTKISIVKLARLICELCGYPDKEIVTTPQEDGGDSERWSNVDRAFVELGWEYKVGLVKGLQRTIRWYQDSHEQALSLGNNH